MQQCEFNLTVVRDISAMLMSVFVITLSGHILSLYGAGRQIDIDIDILMCQGLFTSCLSSSSDEMTHY